jgi:hypothetical protein
MKRPTSLSAQLYTIGQILILVSTLFGTFAATNPGKTSYPTPNVCKAVYPETVNAHAVVEYR